MTIVDGGIPKRRLGRGLLTLYLRPASPRCPRPCSRLPGGSLRIGSAFYPAPSTLRSCITPASRSESVRLFIHCPNRPQECLTCRQEGSFDASLVLEDTWMTGTR